MKANKLFGTLVAVLLCLMAACPQEKTVCGTVTDENALPLPGVKIVVEGTSTGTQTDFDGNYAITVSQGQVLVFTYIGQRDVCRTAGAADVIDVQMQLTD